MSKIAIILGTRPEIIKFSPVIKYCRKVRISFFIVHTNQHNSYIMDKVFLKELKIPEPKYRLSFGLRIYNKHGMFIGKAMQEIEGILLREKPEFVLVQGDTNTALAGALVAAKLPGLKLGHIEAGLRSYDRMMPEEVNRVVADHLSDYLFTPTAQAKKNLLKEGISSAKIFVTGNTIVDVLTGNIAHPCVKVRILEGLKLRRGCYGLLTLHRPENVDNRKRIASIFQGVGMFCRKTGLPLIFPVHPRTRQRIREFKIGIAKGIRRVRPLGFRDFFELEKHARIIFTDSGGIQEESCVLGIPCVTLRDNTERPETVSAGANVIAGTGHQNILKKALGMFEIKKTWKQPLGDGNAAEQIINILVEKR